MKNDNKSRLNFEWVKGFSVETRSNKFFTECLGKATLIFFKGFAVYLLIKALTPVLLAVIEKL